MCLAAFALNAHPRFPLVIAANRDEFFAREAAPMSWWRTGEVEVLAGRDLSAGGTWFGITRTGRLALLTNVREPGRQVAAAPSRGALVVDWLSSAGDATGFLQQLDGPAYNGFNLVVADAARGDWHWFSNRAPGPQQLAPGVHAVSNAALDTPWPKTVGLKGELALALDGATSATTLAARLFEALVDAAPAPDDALPDTGVGLARERLLSPRFVCLPDPAGNGEALYGTRCSTVLVTEILSDGRHQTTVQERSVDARGRWAEPVTYVLPGWF